MKCKSYNYFFEVIANKTRLAILDSLLENPKCVSDMCEELGEEQSKISHNLKKLLECHFVNLEKSGKKRIYSLNKETIEPLIKLVREHVLKNCKENCWRKK